MLRFLAVFSVIVAFVVIALGAFTRLIDAGLGCPDWPGCYGHLLPVATNASFIVYKAWSEMIHRYGVSILGGLIVLLVVLIFSQKKYRQRTNIFLSIALIILLIYQILLGRWTVTLTLWPIVVTQHLLGGFLLAALLWCVYLVNSRFKYRPIDTRLLPWAMIAVVLVFVQIILGAWTSTNYAALSCSDFPFCMNDQSMTWHLREAFQLLPVGVNYEGGVLAQSIRQTIQMVHRIGALVVALYLFIFVVVGLYENKKSYLNSEYFYLIAGLLILQLCLGMMNVVFQLPVIIAVLHTVVAALLFLTLITVTYRMMVRK